jgi:hypothetical protein
MWKKTKWVWSAIRQFLSFRSLLDVLGLKYLLVTVLGTAALTMWSYTMQLPAPALIVLALLVFVFVLARILRVRVWRSVPGPEPGPEHSDAQSRLTDTDSQRIRAQREVAEYVPHMTAKERQIIAYLLAHNQTMFTNTPDGGYANTLISKGIVVCALRPGQTATYYEVPFGVPDHVWRILAEHRAEFPYTPPEPGETAPHPWRVHWTAR